MKKAVILGAGQIGRAAEMLLDRNRWKLLAFGDNNPKTWDPAAEPPVCSVRDAIGKEPDVVIIALRGADRFAQLFAMTRDLGYTGEIINFSEAMELIDVRGAQLRRIAAQIRSAGIPGEVAELGVYQGDFAWQINEAFPQRELYLFDTFEGFPASAVEKEAAEGYSRARLGDFSDVSMERLMQKMVHPEKIHLCKGFFPDSAQGVEERFCFVSLDVDLYEPTLAGLRYFCPRMNPGGVILLHDYNSAQFTGVRAAVDAYTSQFGSLRILPLCDLHGSAVIFCG